MAIKTESIQVPVTKKQRKKADRIAKRQDITVPELFRRWLEVAK